MLIIIGEIKLPKKKPNLVQIIFSGVKKFEFIKPKIKKIIEINKDQIMMPSDFIKG